MTQLSIDKAGLTALARHLAKAHGKDPSPWPHTKALTEVAAGLGYPNLHALAAVLKDPPKPPRRDGRDAGRHGSAFQATGLAPLDGIMAKTLASWPPATSIVLVSGATGAGKTTALRALAQRIGMAETVATKAPDVETQDLAVERGTQRRWLVVGDVARDASICLLNATLDMPMVATAHANDGDPADDVLSVLTQGFAAGTAVWNGFVRAYLEHTLHVHVANDHATGTRSVSVVRDPSAR